jgi:hypothetical protein
MNGMHRHFYEACGLSIVSDAPIEGLRSTTETRAADVTIAMQGTRAFADEDPSYARSWYESADLTAAGQPVMTIDASECGYRLAYRDEATFLVDRAGRHVVARWAPSRSDVDAANYLTGSVLAFVLRLRGSVPLHASAVAVDGGALLFVGESWSGKSSTAAAFSTLGHSLISDDLVRIEASRDGFMAYPAHPSLNVWGDSEATLFGAVDRDAYRKRCIDALHAGYRFQPTPAPIHAVYVLAERTPGGRRPAISHLPPRDALIALVRHTHGGCFLDGEMRVRELEVIARLVEEVPVRELAFGDSLEDLVESCRLIARPVHKDRPHTYE